MQPTFQLRFFSQINQVTADMVRQEQARTDEPMMVCKKNLQAATQPVLQQWFAAEKGDAPEIVADGGQWQDIPVVRQVNPAPESTSVPSRSGLRP